MPFGDPTIFSRPPLGAIHRFLELNLTNDSFNFHVISGVVPNRGFNEHADPPVVWLALHATHERRRSAAVPTAGQALHIEPGLFMNVPGSAANNNQATIVRMGSIPHGTTVLMQGPNPGPEATAGVPNIPVVQPLRIFPVFSRSPRHKAWQS